jgi:hypothetical protein
VNIIFPRWPAVACAFGLCAVLASGCVVAPDAGYGYNPGWPGYYEPYGGAYGGWGPSFLIGPVGGGGYYRGGRGGGYGGGQHAFRAAPASHAAPSIPGGRGGGGRGGGGGGHGRR